MAAVAHYDPESANVEMKEKSADMQMRERRMSEASDASLDEEELAHLKGGGVMTREEVEESALDMDEHGKQGILWNILRFFLLIIGLPALLYVFIIALAIMGEAFKILGAKGSGSTFSDDIVGNPIGGLMAGILATVAVQSSSSTTSVIVSMAGAGFVPPDKAIFMIMGANIGTSVTSTIVALFSAFNRKQFTRAFAAGTVHDFINLLDVLVFLPTEVAFGWLNAMTKAMTRDMAEKQDKGEKTDFINVITKPVTEEITTHIGKDVAKLEACKAAASDPVTECSQLQGKLDKNGGRVVKTFFGKKDPSVSDSGCGIILLILSLVILLVVLVLIVKLLHFSLRGVVGKGLRWALNVEIPYGKDVMIGARKVRFGFKWVTDYLLVIVGTGFTILVQSSSITTSAVTPMVGIGLIGLRKVTPIVHGANIGTCITGIMSAAVSSDLQLGMRVALAHLMFNICGFVLWFVIWPMRAIPNYFALNLALRVGRWRPLAVIYLIVVFALIPVIAFGVSLVGWQAQLIVFWMAFAMAIYYFIPTITIYNKLGEEDTKATMSKHRAYTLCYMLFMLLTPTSLWFALSAFKKTDAPLIAFYFTAAFMFFCLLIFFIIQQFKPQWLPHQLVRFPWVHAERLLSYGTLRADKAAAIQMKAQKRAARNADKTLDSDSTGSLQKPVAVAQPVTQPAVVAHQPVVSATESSPITHAA